MSLILMSLGGCREDALAPTAPEVEPALAVTTAALAFTGISAANEQSCGVTSDSRGYCWGRNGQGELGDGTTTNRSKPVAIAGGLSFRQIVAGYDATCGVTTDNRAYCWGLNERGELGDGTTTQRLTPRAVIGGHKFSQITFGLEHACALSYPDGKAWCWGLNNEGQLGIGTNDFVAHSTPLAVSGGLTFRRLAAGEYHSCGVTTNNKVYCWGRNTDGQLGDGTLTRRKAPKLVPGTLSFVWVDAGGNTTCAVTNDSHAYCWGYGKYGQRGDGSVTERVSSPKPVFGGHLFLRVTQSGSHGCAVTASNQAWCWGINVNGQLGDGTTTNRTTPHLVAGGLAFTQVKAGGSHTCGRTSSAVGYCWGRNFSGELGNGTTSVSTTPVPVSGP
jgi:alpha-tubulin suppressor-like RCC1 family protein